MYLPLANDPMTLPARQVHAFGVASLGVGMYGFYPVSTHGWAADNWPSSCGWHALQSRVAQSLMLGLVANDVAPKDSMWGERSMLEWPLRMALRWPEYAVPKAMFLSGISHAARYGSAVVAEFDERSFALLRDMTAENSPLANLGPLLLHAFGRTEGLAAVRKNTRDARRLAWIQRVTT